MEKFKVSKVNPTFVALEKRLKENCSQEFLVGDKLTAADLVWVNFVWSVVLNPTKSEEERKEIEAKFEKVPLFWAYVNKRKGDFAGRFDTRKPSPI